MTRNGPLTRRQALKMAAEAGIDDRMLLLLLTEPPPLNELAGGARRRGRRATTKFVKPSDEEPLPTHAACAGWAPEDHQMPEETGVQSPCYCPVSPIHPSPPSPDYSPTSPGYCGRDSPHEAADDEQGDCQAASSGRHGICCRATSSYPGSPHSKPEMWDAEMQARQAAIEYTGNSPYNHSARAQSPDNGPPSPFYSPASPVFSSHSDRLLPAAETAHVPAGYLPTNRACQLLVAYFHANDCELPDAQNLFEGLLGQIVESRAQLARWLLRINADGIARIGEEDFCYEAWTTETAETLLQPAMVNKQEFDTMVKEMWWQDEE